MNTIKMLAVVFLIFGLAPLLLGSSAALLLGDPWWHGALIALATSAAMFTAATR